MLNFIISLVIGTEGTREDYRSFEERFLKDYLLPVTGNDERGCNLSTCYLGERRFTVPPLHFRKYWKTQRPDPFPGRLLAICCPHT